MDTCGHTRGAGRPGGSGGGVGPAARFTAGRQDGFTLVEMLVVMLILAILGALAIPAFFSQREKARDADAKSALAVAQVALETWSTDNDGSYADATVPGLIGIEPTLAGVALTIDSVAERTYEIHVISEDGQTFRIERAAPGVVNHTCTPPGAGGCPNDGVF